MFLHAAFPTLLCHERSAGVTCPPFDNTRETARPGGAKAIVADSLLMKQQLLIINRSRRRALNLTAIDRALPGFWSLFLSPHHIKRAAVILRPSTLLKFHDFLKTRKYRLLYSSGRQGKPGPKGPSQELFVYMALYAHIVLDVEVPLPNRWAPTHLRVMPCFPTHLFQ